MEKKRFRLQFKFWLDMNKSDEFELAEVIDQLKRTGSFTQAIRDGIRLMVDLWSGRVGVLLILFPWIEDYFFEKFLEQQPQKDHILTEQLARLEQLLLEQGSQPTGNAVPGGLQKINSGPKPLNVPSSAPPMYEDEDDTDLLVVKKSTGGNSAAQFLQAAFALQGIDYRQ